MARFNPTWMRRGGACGCIFRNTWLQMASKQMELCSSPPPVLQSGQVCTCWKACSRATERALDPATMPCEYWRPRRTIAGWITVEGMLQSRQNKTVDFRYSWVIRNKDTSCWHYIRNPSPAAPHTLVYCMARRQLTRAAALEGLCDCTGADEKTGWLCSRSPTGEGSEIKTTPSASPAVQWSKAEPWR